jgi:hypothetical protein
MLTNFIFTIISVKETLKLHHIKRIRQINRSEALGDKINANFLSIKIIEDNIDSHDMNQELTDQIIRNPN